jgi:serine/threonine protein kinase
MSRTGSRGSLVLTVVWEPSSRTRVRQHTPRRAPGLPLRTAGEPRGKAEAILGSAAYVSPEQAKGHEADRRSDIWAFGAVIYEMLSGRRAFQGDDISETLASVLRHDIDWTVLPASTPEAIRRLIARCLDRNLRQRLRDIGEARIVLGDPESVRVTARPLPRWGSWRRAMIVAIATIVAGALGAAAGWSLRAPPVRAVTRLTFSLPERRHSLPIVASSPSRRMEHRSCTLPYRDCNSGRCLHSTRASFEAARASSTSQSPRLPPMGNRSTSIHRQTRRSGEFPSAAEPP